MVADDSVVDGCSDVIISVMLNVELAVVVVVEIVAAEVAVDCLSGTIVVALRLGCLKIDFYSQITLSCCTVLCIYYTSAGVRHLSRS